MVQIEDFLPDTIEASLRDSTYIDTESPFTLFAMAKFKGIPQEVGNLSFPKKTDPVAKSGATSASDASGVSQNDSPSKHQLPPDSGTSYKRGGQEERRMHSSFQTANLATSDKRDDKSHVPKRVTLATYRRQNSQRELLSRPGGLLWQKPVLRRSCPRTL
jgi:hypothetical protein